MRRVLGGLCVALLSTSSIAQQAYGPTGGGGSVSFANPTGTVGATASNGSAPTAMRSDAAPPLASGAAAANLGFTPPSINGTPVSGHCPQWISATAIGDAGAACGTSSMVYPGPGVPNSTGTGWGTSYAVTGSGSVPLTAGALSTTSGQTYTFPGSTTAIPGLATSNTYTSANTFGTLRFSTLGNATSTHVWGYSGTPAAVSGGTLGTSNGSIVFVVTPTSGAASFSVTMGAATTGWACTGNDLTTKSAGMAAVQETATTTTSVTMNAYTDVMAAGAFGSADTVQLVCWAY